MDKIIELLISVPVILIALTFHECAHGFMAHKLGDETARNLGRLSLNPLRHIDIVGAICMLFFRFGWAKPVPINSRFFKKPRRDIALTALAGPLTNLLLGFIGCLLYSISLKIFSSIGFTETNFAFWLYYAWNLFIFNFAWLNIALAVFNLIPLPPLDGSRIFYSFLPARVYFKIMRYEREIAVAFFIILFLDSRFLDGFITGGLSIIVNFIFNGMMSLFSFIF